MPIDDLGTEVAVRRRPARRVVSLVPSLTEALAGTPRGALVGATDWGPPPPDLDVPRVRGTKNPDRAAIAALQPDLVVANREENRRLDVERLRAAGVAVWVTVIESVEDALRSLRRLFNDGLGVAVTRWVVAPPAPWGRPAPPTGRPGAVPLWGGP